MTELFIYDPFQQRKNLSHLLQCTLLDPFYHAVQMQKEACSDRSRRQPDKDVVDNPVPYHAWD